MLSFLLGVASSLIAAFLVFVVKRVYEKAKAKSDMTGEWTSEFDNSNKVDKFTLTHNRKTGEIKGVIQRIRPAQQTYRSWKCHGILKGDDLLLYFYSEQVIDSSGVAILKLQEDYKFVGKYMRWTKNGNTNEIVIVDGRMYREKNI